jgi:hypothetical protein
MNLLDTEPIMSLDKFIEQTGLSAVTLWRYRKKGMITRPLISTDVNRFSDRRSPVLINALRPGNLLSHRINQWASRVNAWAGAEKMWFLSGFFSEAPSSIGTFSNPQNPSHSYACSYVPKAIVALTPSVSER